jgi:hypothetical protein
MNSSTLRDRTSRQTRRLMLAVLLLVASPGCARFGLGHSKAVIYSHVRGPMFFRAPPSGGLRVDGDLKVGRATARQINVPLERALSIPTGPVDPFTAGWGSLALREAMEDGGIEEVYFADYELFSVLGIYTRVTAVVYGK